MLEACEQVFEGFAWRHYRAELLLDMLQSITGLDLLCRCCPRLLGNLEDLQDCVPWVSPD